MGKVVMHGSVSAPFHFVDGVEAGVAKAQELAGDRIVEIAAGDAGGQVLVAGLVDEVRMDVVPVVFGSGKRYFGTVRAQHLLEDPDVVIRGNRVLHVRCRVRRTEDKDGASVSAGAGDGRDGSVEAV